VQQIKQRQEKEWKPRDFEGAVLTYYRFEDVPIDDGQWLIMGSTNYLLNPVHEWLRASGILFERSGVPSLSHPLLKAVQAWEKLRKGEFLYGDEIKNVYKYIGGEFITKGHRTFKGDPLLEYGIKDLQNSFGLQTDAIWHQALSRISEDKRDYLTAVLRRGTKLSTMGRIKLSTIHGAKGGEADNVLLLMDLSPKFAKEYASNGDNVHRLFYVGITRAKKTLHLVLPKHIEKGFKI
jgi:superfamily I DNA/RNA helicase